MRIGIDAFFTHIPFSGVGQVTAQFLESLQKFSLADFTRRRGLNLVDEPCEFFLYMAAPPEREWPENFHPRVLPPPRKRGVLGKKWWEMRTVPAAVRRDGCDALISLYQTATVLPRAFPHVMVVHDVIYAIFPDCRKRLAARLSLPLSLRGIRRASHCVAVSHYTKADMIRHLGLAGEKISVAHIGAHPGFATFATEEKISAVLRTHRLERGYIYHGGGNHWRKNAEGVLRAYAQLAADKSRALPPLVLSGHYPPNTTGVVDVAALAQTLGIAAHVQVLGMVPQADLPALYRGASMFLYPSIYEGFGLPVLEAMHQGTPVITGSVTSLPEVGGDAVLYCDPNKTEELTAAMRRLLDDEELRRSLSERGLQRAAIFSNQTFADELMERAVTLADVSRHGS